MDVQGNYVLVIGNHNKEQAYWYGFVAGREGGLERFMQYGFSPWHPECSMFIHPDINLHFEEK